jgi:hypothetical protein
MKTRAKFLFFWVCLGLVIACSKSDELVKDTPDNELKSAQVMVTLPFEAYFTGEYVGLYHPGDAEFTCESPYKCRVIVHAAGTASHLGRFTTSFDFCACGPDDPDIEGPDFQYAGGESCFIAANGDKLYLTTEGSSVVVGRLPEHPYFVTSYWKDKFEITGGTGRFEDATGSGTTDDYNSSLDPYSHHHWTGTITLKKGKR